MVIYLLVCGVSCLYEHTHRHLHKHTGIHSETHTLEEREIGEKESERSGWDEREDESRDSITRKVVFSLRNMTCQVRDSSSRE